MRDPLQENLKQMEKKKPSENYHPKNASESFADGIYFYRRAANKSVAEYTIEQRLEDYLDIQRSAYQYAELCRMAALMYRQPIFLTRFKHI